MSHFPSVISMIWISFYLKQYLEYLILGTIVRIDLFVSMKCNKQFWFCELRILAYWGITLVLCRRSRSLFKIRVCAHVCLYVEREQKKMVSNINLFPNSTNVDCLLCDHKHRHFVFVFNFRLVPLAI